MPFGISFGAKKEKQTSTSDINKTETTVGSQSQQTSGVQMGNTTTTSNGQSSTSGTQTQEQNQQQSQSGSTTGRQTGTTTTLGSDVQSGLSDAVKKLLAGGISDGNIASISNLISGAAGFNADKFVQDTVLSARNKGEAALQESNAVRESQIGGTAGTNSMAALLANRGRNDLEANIAGITGQATATAEGIRDQNLQAAVGAQGSLASQAAGLGEVLKGATSTSDVTSLTNQLNELLGKTGTTGSSASATSESQTQNSQTMQLISQLVNALTNTTDTTVGTEKTKTDNLKFGGGFSLGF